MPTSPSNRPVVLITMGEASGIGPEVALKSLASRKVSRLADFLVIGDKLVIDKTAKNLGLTVRAKLIDLANIPTRDFCFGKSKPVFGKASLEYLDKALGILNAGNASALVTAPVNKFSINSFLLQTPNSKLQTSSSQLPAMFQGHTEYLAEKTGVKDVAMMFVSKDLKIVLVTRHVALKDVAKQLTPDAVYKTIIIAHKYLKDFFGIRNPRIGVAGLNPHAGDSGLFGNEENRAIIPAIKKASRSIKGICGPVVPDVIFYEMLNKKYDAVVAMYHDQGLIPFKMLHFKDGVNLTMGLPFIRTSPDHGTAFDIAGRGIADPTSMIEAINLACRLAKKGLRCSPKAS